MTVYSGELDGYSLMYDDQSDPAIVIESEYDNLQNYPAIPSAQRCNEILGTQGILLDLSQLFVFADLLASPRLPEEGVYRLSDGDYGPFFHCTGLRIAPKMPKIQGVLQYDYFFCYCESLIVPATIPNTAAGIRSLYYNNFSLKTPASIPYDVTSMGNIYRSCYELTGEFCIKATNLSSYSNALRNTVEPITIYGDQAVCEAVAATANNGNASWSPWYDPIPAVTDRGQGSYTTAEDMTRMVRNGVLAVDTYAPGRMRYEQGDIVREDEWEALVEAAQTIDPTVTYSTHYTNLNKIEKAFDDAL